MLACLYPPIFKSQNHDVGAISNERAMRIGLGDLILRGLVGGNPKDEVLVRIGLGDLILLPPLSTRLIFVVHGVCRSSSSNSQSNKDAS